MALEKRQINHQGNSRTQINELEDFFDNSGEEITRQEIYKKHYIFAPPLTSVTK